MATKSQAAKYREYQKKWNKLVDEFLKAEKAGKPTSAIRARIKRLNKKYAT